MESAALLGHRLGENESTTTSTRNGELCEKCEAPMITPPVHPRVPGTPVPPCPNCSVSDGDEGTNGTSVKIEPGGDKEDTEEEEEMEPAPMELRMVPPHLGEHDAVFLDGSAYEILRITRWNIQVKKACDRSSSGHIMVVKTRHWSGKSERRALPARLKRMRGAPPTARDTPTTC